MVRTNVGGDTALRLGLPEFTPKGVLEGKRATLSHGAMAVETTLETYQSAGEQIGLIDADIRRAELAATEAAEVYGRAQGVFMKLDLALAARLNIEQNNKALFPAEGGS